MKTTALEVKTTCGPMTVLCHGQRAGLAITEDPSAFWRERGEPIFGVTHVQSGYLIPGRYARPEQARGTMLRLLSLAPWDGDKAAIEARFMSPPLLTRIKRVLGAALQSVDTSATARKSLGSPEKSTPEGGNMPAKKKATTKRTGTKSTKKATAPKVSRARKTATKKPATRKSADSEPG